MHSKFWVNLSSSYSGAILVNVPTVKPSLFVPEVLWTVLNRITWVLVKGIFLLYFITVGSQSEGVSEALDSAVFTSISGWLFLCWVILGQSWVWIHLKHLLWSGLEQGTFLGPQEPRILKWYKGCSHQTVVTSTWSPQPGPGMPGVLYDFLWGLLGFLTPPEDWLLTQLAPDPAPYQHSQNWPRRHPGSKGFAPPWVPMCHHGPVLSLPSFSPGL